VSPAGIRAKGPDYSRDWIPTRKKYKCECESEYWHSLKIFGFYRFS
jgi:hypothetical protein